MPGEFSKDLLKNKQVIERLTALWAFNEAGLGGFLHAFRSPFTGILVGGIAVMIIIMISYFSNFKASVLLKSLLMVLIVKAVVSPHSPLAAYFAVSFQAVIAVGIFSIVKNIRIAALLITVLSFMESAFQKIIVLTLVFGNVLWKAIDQFTESVLKQMGWLAVDNPSNATWWIMGIYVLIYFLAGIAVGIYAGSLPQRLSKFFDERDEFVFNRKIQMALAKKSNPWKKRNKKNTIILSFILPVLIVLFYTLKIKNNWLLALQTFLRAVSIIAVWYLVITPFLINRLKMFLKKRQSTYYAEVNTILALIPDLRKLSVFAWKETSGLKGHKRWSGFIIQLFVCVLIYKPLLISSENGKQDIHS